MEKCTMPPRAEGNLISKENALPVLLILLVSFAVYANIFSNGFVGDDAGMVVGNPSVRSFAAFTRSFANIPAVFERPSAGAYYRPVSYGLAFMAIYSIFGLKAWAFHLANVALHSANAVLVYMLGLLLIGRRRFALVAALLFAVHPVNTDAVDLASAISEPMYSFFFLACIVLFAEERMPWLQGALCLLSALSKEPGVMIPAVLISYDLCIGWRLSWRKYVPFLPALAIYFLLRWNAFRVITFVSSRSSLNLWQLILNSFPLFAKYMGKLAFPAVLNAAYTFHPVTSLLEFKVAVSLLVTACVAGLMALFWKKNRRAFFCCILALAPLLPAFYVLRLPFFTVFAERYLYLSTAGFALLVSMGLERLSLLKNALWKKAAPAVAATVAVLVITAGAAITVKRNPVWKNNETLWSDTVAKSPDNPVPYTYLGFVANDKGQAREAVYYCDKALRINPTYDSLVCLGIAYNMLGRSGIAKAAFSDAASLNPGAAEPHYRLALLYLKKGDLAGFQSQFWLARKLNPGAAGLYASLAQKETAGSAARLKK